jgi:hypothetical protein
MAFPKTADPAPALWLVPIPPQAPTVNTVRDAPNPRIADFLFFSIVPSPFTKYNVVTRAFKEHF